MLVRHPLDEPAAEPEAPPALRRQLGRDHVRLLDVRGPREQLVRLGHQRLGHTPRQVCLAARIVREDVEDGELRVAEPDREPCDRVGLVLDERAPTLEEPRNVRFFAFFASSGTQRPLVTVAMTSPFRRSSDACAYPTRGALPRLLTASPRAVGAGVGRACRVVCLSN